MLRYTKQHFRAFLPKYFHTTHPPTRQQYEAAQDKKNGQTMETEIRTHTLTLSVASSRRRNTIGRTSSEWSRISGWQCSANCPRQKQEHSRTWGLGSSASCRCGRACGVQQPTQMINAVYAQCKQAHRATQSSNSCQKQCRVSLESFAKRREGDGGRHFRYQLKTTDRGGECGDVRKRSHMLTQTSDENKKNVVALIHRL